MKLKDVRYVPYEDLRRWWEVDFSVLVTTAVAEATGEVHQSVREALASDDWIDSWSDALHFGCGELLNSVERMELLGDSRFSATRRRSDLMMKRFREVNQFLKKRQELQGWEMAPGPNRDSFLSALSILSRHYQEEFSKLCAEERLRRGLDERDPLWNLSYRDGLESVEDGVRLGLLVAPVTPEVRRLISGMPGDVKRAAVTDIKSVDDRNDALRHPLVLRRWSEALSELLREHSELCGIDPHPTITLPSVDMESLREMGQEEAMKLINRRRFLRALAQRHRECETHKRQLIREVALRQEEIKKPWRDAAQAARREIGARHPEELKALMEPFSQYCEPGSTVMRKGALPRNERDALIHFLKRKLVDGTLVNLSVKGREKP
jgi:hypothetical protein